MLKRLSLALLLVPAVLAPALAGDRTALAVADITGDVSGYGLVDNAAFVPPEGAAEAHEPFAGTLKLSEGPIFTDPAKFKSNKVLGKNPQVFPGVSLTFITVGSDLVPVTQDVIRNGSTPQGDSFWDIIVQPGKIWSEPDEDGWSRASFPFSLMHSIEGETHNGVATFLFRGDEVSNLRYQILTQTSPFYIEDYFTASGSVKAAYTPGAPADAADIEARYRKSLASAEKIRPWSELEAKFGDRLNGFDSKIRPAEIVYDGIAIGGDFYLKSCPTPAGELPYCDRQRFGVWSVTKAAANGVAMLSIAQKYGKEIFDAKVADYITEAKDMPGWDKASFGDLLNMASGMGYGDLKPEAGISDPFTEPYYAWYEAPTVAGKLDALLKGAKPYPWGPGKVARYRDEDMFLLGVAMTRYLQAKEGPDANVWDFVRREVYEPIGIQYAPINKTIESDPSKDQALMAYGFYPTIGDLFKIARLYQNDGRFGDRQILNAEMMADIKAAAEPVGLPTYNADRPHYRKAFWRGTFKSDASCTFSYPAMLGWGSNFVMLLPKDVTVIRIAKNWDGDAGASDMQNMADVANRIVPLCD